MCYSIMYGSSSIWMVDLDGWEVMVDDVGYHPDTYMHDKCVGLQTPTKPRYSVIKYLTFFPKTPIVMI